MSDVNMNAGINSPAKPISLGLTSTSDDSVSTEDVEAYFYGLTKRIADIGISVFAIIILSPIILSVCIGLLMTQGAPILISHRRVGKHGRSFPCLKFRTMVTNADAILAQHLAADPDLKAEWEATRKLKKDPRVTAFGRTLRKSSLDEIPQLLNVIRGEMSLVGPRPITITETDFYGTHLSAYISVRPGLTGLWQVSGRSETSYAARVELDALYVEKRNLWLDFVIICKTFLVLATSRGSY